MLNDACCTHNCIISIVWAKPLPLLKNTNCMSEYQKSEKLSASESQWQNFFKEDTF